MLPFLKNKQEVPAQDSEELADDFGTLDAVAQDILEGIEKKDKSLIKSALSALCEYIKEEDEEQDKTLTNKE